MTRIRLYDVRLSRMPSVVGLCQSDVQGIANFVNAAENRLLLAKEAGDEGWWGTWAEMAFTVRQTAPYLTTPRSVARIQVAALCDEVIPLQNQFFEYLDFGNGRLPKTFRRCEGTLTQAYTRNNVPTWVDLSNPPQIIRVYFSDTADVGRRVLLQGTDSNDVVVRSLDTYNPTLGQFVTLASPFVDAPMQFNSITGIQKDITFGNVEIKQVDPTSGAEVSLLIMEPSEQTATYRRYYFDELPASCCCAVGTVQNLTLTAIVKLEKLPVMVDTDYCLLPNLEAITEECQSIRLSECDSPTAKQLSRERHQAAISLLNGQLNHYLGTQKPAVSFEPFGSAKLWKQAIGRLI